MSNPDNTNPRLAIGGNMPPLARSIASEQEDFALVTTAFLEDEYASKPKIVLALLEEARALPAEIDGDETKSKYTHLIKRLRDEAKAIDAIHGKEKTPYLRGGQAVDQFCFGLIDKLARRDKRGKAGAADILLARLTDYDTKVLNAELERRRAAAAEAARIEREAREKADREAREAEEARRAAERARKPETIEQKAQIASAAQADASVSRAAAQAAEAAAAATRVESLARPADIMRTRGADGTLSTMATEPYADVLDSTKLDKEKLWPFLTESAKEQALRAWARNTGHTVQMDGASIGKRPKSSVR